ncbi:MAG: hypothetical protein CMP67_07205 [Flavobacteriales bacterium]|nr:hypothetical protein [Flavobacteriales bacterium]
MRQLSNFFHYLFILPRVKFRLNRINKVLKNLKKEVCKNSEWALIISSKSFDLRLTQYVQVHSLLDFSLCGLAGRKMSNNELKACVYFCACLPLYDDFFDKSDLSEKEIKDLMLAPESFTPENSVQELFIYLLRIVYKNLHDSDLFSKYFEQLYYGQEESKKLVNPNLSKAEVEKIAFQKGGYSALLFRSILKHPIIVDEEKALYQLGAVGQVLDDLFDLWDDLEEGINTIVTKFNRDFTPVYAQYLHEVEKLKLSFQKLNYTQKNKNKFIRELMLMVNGGTLCGQHYLKLQEKNGGVFDIQKIGREALICDMEKRSNWLKMIKQSILNA